MSYLPTSTVRLAATIHDALRQELEGQAESGGQVYLGNVRSLFRQWEFQPGEVHELFKRVAMKLRNELDPKNPLRMLRVSSNSNRQRNAPLTPLQLFRPDD